MPNAKLNAQSVTIGLTPVEMGILQSAADPTGDLQRLISGYLQQQEGRQSEQEKQQLRTFIEDAPAQKRAALLATMKA